MSEINGQLVNCDRCGAQIFRKAIGEGEADGGYTRWNKFEDYPPGWETVEIPVGVINGHFKSRYIKVCPKCNSLWHNLLNDGFLKDTELYLKNVENTGLTGDSN